MRTVNLNSWTYRGGQAVRQEIGVTECWRDSEPFRISTNALRGEFWRAGNSLGRLPDSERVIFSDYVKRYGRRLFVVYSYATPIAWRCEDDVYLSPARYSVTTSKHQGKLY